MVQLVRIVDSSKNEYFLDVITPRTSFEQLDQRHFQNPEGLTPLAKMVKALGLNSIADLSPTFVQDPEERSPSWVQVYRELNEWAVLLTLVTERHFGTDTVILFDGLLRSKIFRDSLFAKNYRDLLEAAIKKHFVENRRNIYLAGIAKNNKILQRYRLAMALESVMRNSYPCYLEVPDHMERAVYKWDEYFRAGPGEKGEENKYVAGNLYFVKFGLGPNDPVWAIDIFLPQISEAATIFGYLLEDAKVGFPIPYYPLCLQKAHEEAQLTGFDMTIMQDRIIKSVRNTLGQRGPILDELALQAIDPAATRYQ